MELENRLLKMENKISVLDTNVKLLLGLIQGLKKDMDERCPAPSSSKAKIIIPDTRNYPNLTFSTALPKSVPQNVSTINWSLIKKPTIPPLSISITPTAKAPVPAMNPIISQATNTANRPCPKSKKMPQLIRRINPNHAMDMATKEIKIVSCSTLATPTLISGQPVQAPVRRSRRSTKSQKSYRFDNNGESDEEEEVHIQPQQAPFIKLEPRDKGEAESFPIEESGNGCNNFDDEDYVPSPPHRESTESRGSHERKRKKFSSYSLKVSTDYQFSYKCLMCDINFERKFHQVKHYKEFHENEEVIPKFFDNSKFRLIFDLLSSWRENEDIADQREVARKSIPALQKLKNIAYALATADVDKELAPDTEFVNRSLWAWIFENFFVKGSKQQVKSAMDLFNGLYNEGAKFREIIDLGLTTDSNVTKDPSINHVYDDNEESNSNQMEEPELISPDFEMDIGSPMPHPDFSTVSHQDSIDIYEHELFEREVETSVNFIETLNKKNSDGIDNEKTTPNNYA